jgi:hypothetical protein
MAVLPRILTTDQRLLSSKRISVMAKALHPDRKLLPPRRENLGRARSMWVEVRKKRCQPACSSRLASRLFDRHQFNSDVDTVLTRSTEQNPKQIMSIYALKQSETV